MSNDRRRYFRIEDRVLMQTRLINPTELEQKLEDFWANRHQFFIRNEFNHNLNEHIADFRAIQNKMPELARYLEVLQRQIDHLTSTVLPEQSPTFKQDINVSLSAQGISFTTDEVFKPVDVVELSLKLQPSHQELVILARVVLVEDINDIDFQDNSLHRISLDFEFIHDADREILVKHIHEKQIRALGAKHDNNP
ncbi:MAG: hypothetical protein GY820_11445 [Gammaproteobacteria bacterium]|nr:hypothetical protein [Gammaproteobacteria bacterium]